MQNATRSLARLICAFAAGVFALTACSRHEPSKPASKAPTPAPTAKTPPSTTSAPASAPEPASAKSIIKPPEPQAPFEVKLCTLLKNATEKSASEKKPAAVMFVIETPKVFKDPLEFGRNAQQIDSVASAACPADREKFLALAKAPSLLEALKPPGAAK